MKNYIVTLPITGTITCEVEAADENAALRKALEMSWLDEIKTTPEFELDGIDSYEALVKGNFSCVDLLEAEVEEQESDE